MHSLVMRLNGALVAAQDARSMYTVLVDDKLGAARALAAAARDKVTAGQTITSGVIGRPLPIHGPLMNAWAAADRQAEQVLQGIDLLTQATKQLAAACHAAHQQTALQIARYEGRA